MDFLQIALIFLILLISIFLAISGFQVFFILRDLHKSLRRFDKILETSQDIVKDIEKPAKAASNIASVAKATSDVAKVITGSIIGKSKSKNRRFYKKVL